MRLTMLSEPAYGNKTKKECSSGLNPDLPAKIQGIFQQTEDSRMDFQLPMTAYDPSTSTSWQEQFLGLGLSSTDPPHS